MKKQKENHIAFTLAGIKPPVGLVLDRKEIEILKKALSMGTYII